MGSYREDAGALKRLVEADRVHRDVYTDAEVFQLEMERLWSRTWIYVGHTSQVPNPGDFLTLDVAAQPVIVVRHTDNTIRVLLNRCAHKGTKVVYDTTGNAGKTFRCPYHAWTYRTDGTLLQVPLKEGYAADVQHNGLSRINSEVHRGFIFARLAKDGIGFRGYFGDSLSSIDNLADRSPDGELEIAGGVLRYLHNCNWKMFVENLNDTMHPMIAHASSAGTAKRLWADKPADMPKPMSIEQIAPFASDYKFFDDMGVKVYPHGHGFSGVNFSIHSSYSSVPEYEAAMKKAYGEERAKKILGTVRHNTVYYPSLTIKGAIQSIRVARPLAADKTLIESYTFRLKGAPDALLQRTIAYNRLINSPMSVVGHDDLHCYRSIQEGLAAQANDWVGLQRNFKADETGEITANGTSEISMRNQFRAWAEFMAP
ncbi:MAG: 3-phenylpropionate/trans-cinnamate dioxygenase subunit alpha [Betaproteobacteria bacterium]|jgi:phenylpropionate dioxygenase-like ring-hydroxylating dioxygenase large terminal subunit|nr:3-phenylpropionate/trans-cinnamate dioxygenase subunit alpha [Betaproteobacteria bacterium]